MDLRSKYRNFLSYSILLMRDDHAVSAFRLRAMWLKLFFLFIILLLLACLAGAYGSYYYSSRYSRASTESAFLRKELAAARVQLQEYANLSIIPEHGAQTAGSFGTMVVPVAPQVQEAEAASPGVSRMLIAGTSPLPEELRALLGQGGPAEGAGISESFVMAGAGAHPIKIEKLQGRQEGQGGIRLTFDLHNREQSGSISGTCSVAAVTRSGAVVELPTTQKGALSFKIERYRKMQGSLVLPKGLAYQDIAAFKITASVKDHPDYWQIFAQ